MTMRERVTLSVTKALACAADGEAKDEIIEELSGNLYTKYEDFVRAGADPEEAFGWAMDSLGDVSELVELAGGSRTRAELERAMDSVLSAVKGVAQDIKEPLKDMVGDICHVAQAAKEPLKDVGRAIAGAVKDLGAAHTAQDADVEAPDDPDPDAPDPGQPDD